MYGCVIYTCVCSVLSPFMCEKLPSACEKW